MRLTNFSQNWLKPVAAVMTLLITAVVLVSSTVLKDGVSYAIASSGAQTNTVKLSDMPPAMLTDQQIMEQLADSPNYTNGKPVPQFGIYDPLRRIRTQQGYIRHSFVDWRDSRQLAEQLLISERLGATPLITLEPRGQDNGQLLLSDIAEGKYDALLSHDFSIISSVNGTVYLRFAHEMDLENLYPWGAQDPTAFIAAYRHTVDLARSEKVNNIKWVWSPAGNPNASAYYPGDGYVDVIGTTILYDQYWYNDYQPSFRELSAGRQWLLSYGKPVWIVEFGAGAANPEFQSELIKDALSNFRAYGYSALVYLNIQDSNIQGPDYRIASLSVFGDNLKTSMSLTGSPAVPIELPVSGSNKKPALINQASPQLPDQMQLTLALSDSKH